jgi:hypothetical protein
MTRTKPLFSLLCLHKLFLATASNCGNSSASCSQVLLSQPSVKNSLSTVNSIISLSLLSLPCRAQLNCQLTTNWIARIVFFITTLQRQNRTKNTVFNNNSIVVEASLRIRCLETGCITPFFYCCGHYLVTAAAYRATA